MEEPPECLTDSVDLGTEGCSVRREGFEPCLSAMSGRSSSSLLSRLLGSKNIFGAGWREGGARVSDYFIKDQNLKKKYFFFFFGGGGGGGGGLGGGLGERRLCK